MNARKQFRQGWLVSVSRKPPGRMVRDRGVLYPARWVVDVWTAGELIISLVHAVYTHLRAHLLRHLVAMSTMLGMLLVPATCANAAGPHSLFMSPMSNQIGAMQHGDSEMAGMSSDEHAMHMDMGHAEASPEIEIESEPVLPASNAAIQTDAPVQETGVRLSDLPSTMAMAAVSNPAAIAELEAIEFPSHPTPATPRSTDALSGRSISLELPPPR